MQLDLPPKSEGSSSAVEGQKESTLMGGLWPQRQNSAKDGQVNVAGGDLRPH